jgi:hypothetical protein
MNHVLRPWVAAAGAVMALASAPVVIATIASPAVSRADVCMAGQYDNAGVCVNILDDPAIYAPPPPPPVACGDVSGRHVTVGGCT